MKKALQIAHLRARGSVSDRAVVRGLCERRFYRFRDRFAEVRILDLRGERSRLPRLLRGRLDRRRRHLLRRRIGQRARDETESRAAGEPGRDLAGALGQLEAPDRVADMHYEGAVRLRPRRPGVARDLVTDGGRPGRHRVSRAAVGSDATQLRADLLAERLHYAAASSTAPGVTSSS